MVGERVTVTVDEAYLARVPEVAEGLRRRGMRVESVLEGLGIVTGEADDPASLRSVDGVQSVDAQLRHDIGPPGAEVQRAPADAPEAPRAHRGGAGVTGAEGVTGVDTPHHGDDEGGADEGGADEGGADARSDEGPQPG
jgi:hypothetical protein